VTQAFTLLLPGCLVLAVLAIAVATDVRSRRIPNWLILTGWALALAWHTLGPAGSWSFDSRSPGAAGPLGAVMGLAVLLILFFPFYVLRIMGAGDVKLMSVVGAFFGATITAWTHLVGLSLFVLAAGGLLALSRMLAARSGAAVVHNLGLIVAGCVARASGRGAPAFDAANASADRMPYAVAIMTGTILYVVAKWAGWMKVL